MVSITDVFMILIWRMKKGKRIGEEEHQPAGVPFFLPFFSSRSSFLSSMFFVLVLLLRFILRSASFRSVFFFFPVTISEIFPLMIPGPGHAYTGPFCRLFSCSGGGRCWVSSLVLSFFFLFFFPHPLALCCLLSY